jgi:hypothetical protein
LLLQGILVPPGDSSFSLMLAMILYLVIALAAGLLNWVHKPWLMPVLYVLSIVIILSCFATRYQNASDHWLWDLLYDPPPRREQDFLAMVLLFSLCMFLGRIVFFMGHLPGVRLAKDRWVWHAVIAPVLIFGLFDAVIGFAVAIYPFIPFEKGGGNYRYASEVTIQAPNDSNVKGDQKYVVLMETSDYLYVAMDNPGEESNRENWGKLGIAPPADILQIRRDSITAMDCQPWSSSLPRRGSVP